MLKKFDSACAPNDKVLTSYFCDGLSPSIQAQTDERSQDIDLWEEAIKKGIDNEAKAACQPWSLMKEIYNQCSQGHRPIKID